MSHTRNYLVGRRRKLKLTQKALAKKLGISTRQYMRIESGDSKISFERFDSICSELDLMLLFVPGDELKKQREFYKKIDF